MTKMSIEDRLTDKKRTLVSRMLFKKLDLNLKKLLQILKILSVLGDK